MRLARTSVAQFHQVHPACVTVLLYLKQALPHAFRDRTEGRETALPRGGRERLGMQGPWAAHGSWDFEKPLEV